MIIGIGIPFIRRRGGGPSNTPRTSAFLTATGITDATIISALNAMDNSLISAGLLPSGTGAGKIKALYPIVGGTAATHKFNFVNPLDTDSAFRLVFFGGWTHSANGALPNGTNGYADTFFVPTTNFNSLNDKCFGAYIGTNTNNGLEMGSLNGSYIGDQLVTRISNICVSSNSNLNDALAITSTNSQGFWISTRSNSLSGNYYKNGTSIITLAASASQYNQSIFIGARRFLSSAEIFSDKRIQLAFMGDGLNGTEAVNFTNLVQTFQTTLSRNV
jgi:hypothetical protein